MTTRLESIGSTLGSWAYAILGYLSFLATIGYLIGFLADLGVPKSVDRGAGPLGPALAVDLALVALFGLQHSVMARPGFKRRLAALLPAPLERSTFVLASGLVLALLYWFWRPIPAILWEVGSPAGRTAIWTVYALAWAVAILATFVLSHPWLFGLSQVAAWRRGEEEAPLDLRTPGLYRLVRHPMTAGLIVAFWATPRMTAGHLILAIGMTVYCLIGTWFEERDLLRILGERYRAYRRRVPSLLPWPRPDAGRRARPAALLLLAAPALAAVLLVAADRSSSAGASAPGRGELPRTAPDARPVAGLGGASHPSGSLAGPPHAASPAEGERRLAALAVDGRERRFELYRPAFARSAAPLLLALHGSGGSGERLRHFLGGELERLADAHGFLVAYPQAWEGSWNGCRAAAPSAANRFAIDDVGFLRALVASLAADGAVDPRRVGVLGFSGGGHMAYRLALEAPDAFPAVAVFAASLPVEEELDCTPTGRAVSVLAVAGTADLVNPYRGGDVVAPDGTALGRVRSAPESVLTFSRLAGALGQPVSTVLVSAPPSVERLTWRRGDTEVSLVTVHGGGHAIPGPRTRLPALVGRTERRWNGVEEAVRFLLDRPRVRESNRAAP